MIQGLYGQGKSGEDISFSRWQGKSGRVRESQGIQRKSQEKVGKSQEDFFGKFLSPMNQDPLFILAIVCQRSFCWLILYCSFIF